MKDVIVLGGTNGEHLAIKLASLLDAELGEVEVKRFPDGETYVRILSDVNGRKAVYVNSLYDRPNEAIIETLYTLDALRDLGASRIYAVIPYMAYARQDSRFQPGEAISILSLAKLFKTIKTDGIYTIDMHLHRIRNPSALFGSNFYNLTGVGELAKYVRSTHNLRDAVVIGPDEESEQWAKTMAESLGGLEYSVLEKKRISAEEVMIDVKDVEVKGRNVIVVDDIISTGGTISEAVKALRGMGVREIIVACVHPLLVGRAYQRLLRLNLKDVVGTDTVISPISRVSVAPAIAEAVLRQLGTPSI